MTGHSHTNRDQGMGPSGSGLDIARSGLTQHYTFVDYVTQGYSLVVALLIICFHNQTVSLWGFVLACHGVQIIGIHILIEWYARRPENRILDLARHLYPVVLYLWFFAETGDLNRMFFNAYLDPILV